jgi:hypothetical protein
MYKPLERGKYIPNTSKITRRGEIAMTRVNPVSTISPGPAKAFAFFGKFTLFGLAIGSHRSGDGTDGNSVVEPSHERYDCGGYNEAFIMQQWASYNLH